MDLLEKARAALKERIQTRKTNRSLAVVVRPLSPGEAIGQRAGEEFPIQKGSERVIEASFQGFRGQAFTDQPASWKGTVAELLDLDLGQFPNRAVFVAGLNAVMRSWGEAAGTLHCRNEDPDRCGPEIARIVHERFGSVRVGLIGLQPAILRALVARFGTSSVSLVDLNPDNIGQVRSGVTVWDGEQDLPRLVAGCDMGLATGSAVVNGTLVEILDPFRNAGKPVLLFGNTISGVAELLGLDRLCPYGRSD